MSDIRFCNINPDKSGKKEWGIKAAHELDVGASVTVTKANGETSLTTVKAFIETKEGSFGKEWIYRI